MKHNLVFAPGGGCCYTHCILGVNLNDPQTPLPLLLYKICHYHTNVLQMAHAENKCTFCQLKRITVFFPVYNEQKTSKLLHKNVRTKLLLYSVGNITIIKEMKITLKR